MQTMPHDESLQLPGPRATAGIWLASPAVALLLLMLATVPVARAADPGVHSDFLNGAVRVTLDGSYAGARYTVQRAEGPSQPFRVLGERDALCTGDCYVLDSDALVGATDWD